VIVAENTDARHEKKLSDNRPQMKTKVLLFGIGRRLSCMIRKRRWTKNQPTRADWWFMG